MSLISEWPNPVALNCLGQSRTMGPCTLMALFKPGTNLSTSPGICAADGTGVLLFSGATNTAPSLAVKFLTLTGQSTSISGTVSNRMIGVATCSSRRRKSKFHNLPRTRNTTSRATAPRTTRPPHDSKASANSNDNNTNSLITPMPPALRLMQLWNRRSGLVFLRYAHQRGLLALNKPTDSTWYRLSISVPASGLPTM